MSIVVSTITNQYGNEVTEQEYYLSDGLWYEQYINCRNAASEGLGTCQCHSHRTYDSWPVSREKVRKAVESRITELSEEERADLLDNSLEKRIDEKFRLLGFTLKQVETWAADCYKMNLNPLPTLRKHLEGICEVGFMYDQNGVYFGDISKDTLMCRLHKDDNPSETRVYFEIHEGTKPEPDSGAYLWSAEELYEVFKGELQIQKKISLNVWKEAQSRDWFGKYEFLKELDFYPTKWEDGGDGYMYPKK
jgi:hypothetical protein